MKTLDARIQEHVDAFVGNVEQLIREMTLATVTRRMSVKKRPIGRGQGWAKRKPEVLAELTERLYRAVCASPGASMRALSEAIEQTPRELQLPVHRLLSDGRIKKTGQRDQTRYFPVGREPKGRRRRRVD